MGKDGAPATLMYLGGLAVGIVGANYRGYRRAPPALVNLGRRITQLFS